MLGMAAYIHNANLHTHPVPRAAISRKADVRARRPGIALPAFRKTVLSAYYGGEERGGEEEEEEEEEWGGDDDDECEYDDSQRRTSRLVRYMQPVSTHNYIWSRRHPPPTVFIENSSSTKASLEADGRLHNRSTR
jgi:hypothetical protein